MHLSLYADYSCRVLIYLSIQGKRKVSIKEISEAYGISANHLVKVVHNLGKLGFITTSRGRGGGITLAQPANEISLGAVVRQTEPNLFLVECFNHERNTCPIVPVCGLRSVLKEALEEFFRVLDRYTIADVNLNPSKLKEILAGEVYGA